MSRRGVTTALEAYLAALRAVTIALREGQAKSIVDELVDAVERARVEFESRAFAGRLAPDDAQSSAR